MTTKSTVFSMCGSGATAASPLSAAVRRKWAKSVWVEKE